LSSRLNWIGVDLGLRNRYWLDWHDLVDFRDIYTWYVTWVLGSCDWPG